MGNDHRDIAGWSAALGILIWTGCSAEMEESLDYRQSLGSEILIAAAGQGQSRTIPIMGQGAKGRHRGRPCDAGRRAGEGGATSGAGGSPIDAGPDGDAASAGDGAVGGALILSPAQLSQNWQAFDGNLSFDSNGGVRWSVAFPPDGSTAQLFGGLPSPSDWSGYTTMRAFFSFEANAMSVESIQFGVFGGPDGVSSLFTDARDLSGGEVVLDLSEFREAVSPAIGVDFFLNARFGATTLPVMDVIRLELQP